MLTRVLTLTNQMLTHAITNQMLTQALILNFFPNLFWNIVNCNKNSNIVCQRTIYPIHWILRLISIDRAKSALACNISNTKIGFISFFCLHIFSLFAINIDWQLIAVVFQTIPWMCAFDTSAMPRDIAVFLFVLSICCILFLQLCWHHATS